MYRTEIFLEGFCYRIVGTYEEALEGAREVAAIAGVNTSGDRDQLADALMDSDEVAWVDVALPVSEASHSYPHCPECDLIGSFTAGDTSDYCEACGYDSGEA